MSFIDKLFFYEKFLRTLLLVRAICHNSVETQKFLSEAFIP